MRARKRTWTQSEIENNSLIFTDGKENKGAWHKLFNNDHPIHIEIGSGNGNFITEMSLRHPEINYIAFEREKEVIVSGARKMRHLKEEGTDNKNIVFIIGDAANLLDYFEAGELERIYINFCDPWPNRKKWHKRRLTHKNFLKTYRILLGDQGEIHFKTDNMELFEFSLNEIAGDNWGMRNITLDLHNSEFEGNIMTEYEKKFSEKGMPIYRLEAFIK